MKNNQVSFDDTEIAFISKSNSDLVRAFWLFKMIGYPFLVKISSPFVNFALKAHLPVKGIIRATAFRQFCGGETINECQATISGLAKYNIGTILDYSVEGKDSEEDFENALAQTLSTIQRAKGDPNIPFSVFKPSGFVKIDLLEKKNSKQLFTPSEEVEYSKFKQRIFSICKSGFESNVPVYIDAEESWIQDAVDELVQEMMMEFNKKNTIVYNTLQFYRIDRFEFLKKSIEHARTNNYFAGFKLVRGAYMEKERERANRLGYTSPIHADKAATDRAFNTALKYCVDHIAFVSICNGTHNEQSCLNLVQWMSEQNFPNNHPHIWFSQLYGMSDHISYNLSKKGYNVSKYVPFGPIKDVLPYLIRRAQENTSAAGQTGRELTLIIQEKKRRGI